MERVTTTDPCPVCGSTDVRPTAWNVNVTQGGRFLTTEQHGTECLSCGEQWSTHAQCDEADQRLVAQGWKPRGAK